MSEQIRALLSPASGDPIPLYCPEKNFCIIWSAKSGCTMMLLWYFGHMNMLGAQKDYNVWPHFYRLQVACSSPDYLRAIAAADIDSIRWLRTIRDPFTRAVSSYKQALLEGYNDALVAEFLGRAVNAASGYSFREYVDWLLQADPASVNPHERAQRHRLEDLVRPQVLVLDGGGMWGALDAFEAANGIEPMLAENRQLMMSEAARVGALHHASRKSMKDAAEMAFRRQPKPEAWPSYDDFLTLEIREKLALIYRTDLEAYAEYL